MENRDRKALLKALPDDPNWMILMTFYVGRFVLMFMGVIGFFFTYLFFFDFSRLYKFFERVVSLFAP